MINRTFLDSKPIEHFDVPVRKVLNNARIPCAVPVVLKCLSSHAFRSCSVQMLPSQCLKNEGAKEGGCHWSKV
jgi:hypothetical protein